jgi:hypothetical protein
MKRTLSPQERDAFAVALSEVAGQARTDEQSKLFPHFDQNNVPIAEQIKALNERYSRAQ